MKTILKTIKNLRHELDEFESSIALDITHFFTVPAIVYTHTGIKILYGDYSALTTLGYHPEKLAKEGRRILIHNINPKDSCIREKILTFLVQHPEEQFVGNYQLKGKDRAWHTMLVYAKVHSVDENGTPEQIINTEFNLSYLNQSEEYKEMVDRALWSTVTKRESDIVRHIAEGYRNSEIAENLGISINTVETHRKNLLRKLGMKNITSLMRFVSRYKLLE